MRARTFTVALAALALACPTAASAQSHPIDPGAPDGWRMLESLPTYDKVPCTARMGGAEINMNLSLNNDGVPFLVLARPDWRDMRGEAVAKVSVDGSPAEDQPMSMVNNLVVGLVQNPTLLQRLKSGHKIAWTLPMGRFEGRIEGFDTALKAVTACIAKRDGRAT